MIFHAIVACCRWYTLCGAQHPQQATPDCNVESKFYETFNQIAELNPNGTNIIYLNSMFDFVGRRQRCLPSSHQVPRRRATVRHSASF